LCEKEQPRIIKKDSVVSDHNCSPLMATLYLLCVYLVGDICVLVEPKYLRYILQIQTCKNILFNEGYCKRSLMKSTQNLMICQLITNLIISSCAGSANDLSPDHRAGLGQKIMVCKAFLPQQQRES
jgi:hypothetical protein